MTAPSAPTSIKLRRVAVGAAIGAGAAALAWVAGLTPIARQLEDATWDQRVAWTATPAPADSPIAIVLIDEASIRALAPILGSWPWPRAVHAGVLDYLIHAGAKTIAIDLLFTERDKHRDVFTGGRTMTGGESDGEFVDAVRRAGNVVLLADATFEGTAGQRPPDSGDPMPAMPGPVYRLGAGFELRPDVLPPFSELSLAATAVGHNYLVKDADDEARRMRPFVETARGSIPSLGVAAFIAARNVPSQDVSVVAGDLRIGDRRMPLVEAEVPCVTGRCPSRQVILNFRRPVRDADGAQHTFPVYSYFNVLLSEDRRSRGELPEVPAEAFKDKIVFIGTSAAGLADIHATPLEGAGAPGVLLHATLADNLIANRFMRRSSRGGDVATTVALGLLAGVLATSLPVSWGTGVVLAMAAAFGWWLVRQVGHGVWMGAVEPLSAAALALFGGVAWQYFVEGAEKRRVRQLFGRYVSPAVIEQLMENPALARLGGDRREMTVLFSDIRGFTSASEQGQPEAVVAQLNEYFEAMVAVLFRHQGTLDKFVGDMVMGLFGAPLDDRWHADHAVAAAREMSTTLDALNARWKAEGRPTLDIGIGINSGEMIAGNIGSSAIMSYTVIGDAVNLGARLESLNKEYKSRILISEATHRRLRQPIETRLVGEVTVKGRQQPVVVYEVVTNTSGV
jgi:adenylate cyclase